MVQFGVLCLKFRRKAISAEGARRERALTAAFLMYAIATCINFLQTIMAEVEPDGLADDQPGGKLPGPGPGHRRTLDICRFSLNSWCDFRNAFRFPAKRKHKSQFLFSVPIEGCQFENMLYETIL